MREIIKAQRERGATVLLNSHLLSEVERTCDRVAFIQHGEVLETRELEALLDGETSVAVRARKLPVDVARGLALWATAVALDGERLTFRVADANALPEVLRYLVAQGADVYEFTPERQSLEELFLEIVGSDGGL